MFPDARGERSHWSTVAAPAKLNLALRIVGRRADGYHLLDSLVAPIALFDQVRVSLERQATTDVALCCTPDSAARLLSLMSAPALSV